MGGLVSQALRPEGLPRSSSRALESLPAGGAAAPQQGWLLGAGPAVGLAGSVRGGSGRMRADTRSTHPTPLTHTPYPPAHTLLSHKHTYTHPRVHRALGLSQTHFLTQAWTSMSVSHSLTSTPTQTAVCVCVCVCVCVRERVCVCVWLLVPFSLPSGHRLDRGWQWKRAPWSGPAGRGPDCAALPAG